MNSEILEHLWLNILQMRVSSKYKNSRLKDMILTRQHQKQHQQEGGRSSSCHDDIILYAHKVPGELMQTTQLGRAQPKLHEAQQIAQ